MTFLIDAQLPPALVAWLREQGHEADHVDGLGLRNADDLTIWAYAVNREATIVTKDEDFAERASRDTDGPTIVWLRIGNATNRTLFQWITPRWSQIIALLDLGNRVIEVR